MQRLSALDPKVTTGKSKEMFNVIQTKLGMIPNMMRTMGNSPAVLNGYLSFNAALADSSIGPKLGELIALTVANINKCAYCNAAHSLIGEKLVHIPVSDIAAARYGNSPDPKIQAALDFAKIMVNSHGAVEESDVSKLKSAGYDNSGIAEIIAHVGLNIFTNYFNNAIQVIVDFPEVELV